MMMQCMISVTHMNIVSPRPLIDSILTMMTVWRIRRKIIRTAITFT